MKLNKAFAKVLGIQEADIPSRLTKPDKLVRDTLEGMRKHEKIGADMVEEFLAFHRGETPVAPVSVAIPPPVETPVTEEEKPVATGEPIAGRVPKIAIMGQENASFLLQGFINSFAETGEFSKAILLTADAGTGKTRTFNILSSAVSDLTKGGVNVVECGAASDFATIDSEPSQALLQALSYSAQGVHTLCKIDEAHLLSSCGEAMRRVFDTLIYGAGEGWKVSGSVTVGKKTYHYNGRFLTLVLITNQPELISRRNATAVKRRFLNIPLGRYSAEIMKKLTPLYFKEKGFAVEPDALKELVKFHRGTLVALDDFLSRADGHMGGTKVISHEVFKAVEPSCEYTLRGFTRTEIQALRWLATTTEPRTTAGLVRSFAGLDVTEFYRHAKRQDTMQKGVGVNTPFILIKGTQYEVTHICQAFLDKNPSI